MVAGRPNPRVRLKYERGAYTLSDMLSCAAATLNRACQSRPGHRIDQIGFYKKEQTCWHTREEFRMRGHAQAGEAGNCTPGPYSPLNAKLPLHRWISRTWRRTRGRSVHAVPWCVRRNDDGACGRVKTARTERATNKKPRQRTEQSQQMEWNSQARICLHLQPAFVQQQVELHHGAPS